jgi:hypothetical protein
VWVLSKDSSSDMIYLIAFLRLSELRKSTCGSKRKSVGEEEDIAPLERKVHNKIN